MRSCGAFGFSQSWHDIDPAGLRLEGDRLTGSVRAVINIDPYLREAGIAGGAGTVKIDATLAADGTIQGTFEAAWGEAAEFHGTATGTVTE